MKKLFIILLPILLVIAFLFFYKGEIFDFEIFLDIISNWNFDNELDILRSIRDDFSNALHVLEVGLENNSFGLITNGIFSLLKTLVTAQFDLLKAAFMWIVNVINNVVMIADYLF